MAPTVTTTSKLPAMTIDGLHPPSGLLTKVNHRSKPNTARTSSPTSITAPLTTFIIKPRTCYLCDEQNPGDFSPTTKHLQTCLLCNRHFCPIHHDIVKTTICNINHSQYYHSRLEQTRHHLSRQTTKPETRDSKLKEEAEESLARAGIFPSLGERDKTLLRSSTPTSNTPLRPQPQTDDHDNNHPPSSPLIETKDLIGADIAV